MQRFDDIRAYFAFGEADEANVRASLPILAPCLEELVLTFAEHIANSEFAGTNFRSKARVAELRRFSRRWLASVFGQPYEERSFPDWIQHGRTQLEVGVLPQYLLGASAALKVALEQQVIELPDGAAVARSLGKVLDIELTIMLHTCWSETVENRLHVPATLAAGLAHEIRNPLNAIGLHVTLLERRLKGVDIQDRHVTPVLESVRAELRKIGGLTSEIIDFSRPVALDLSWVDGNELLARLRQNHSPAMAMLDIDFVTELDGAPKIYCDRDEMMLVLVTLISNAIDSLTGRDVRQVRVSIKNRETETRVEVVDTGQGISPDVRGQIFDLFFTTRASGTGLGLPIAHKVVKAHGGRIELQSKVGNGTTFAVVFPRPTPV